MLRFNLISHNSSDAVVFKALGVDLLNLNKKLKECTFTQKHFMLKSGTTHNKMGKILL